MSYFIEFPVWAQKLIIDSPVKFWCGTRILLNDKVGFSNSLKKMRLRLLKSLASKMLSKNDEHVEAKVYSKYKCVLKVCVHSFTAVF